MHATSPAALKEHNTSGQPTRTRTARTAGLLRMTAALTAVALVLVASPADAASRATAERFAARAADRHVAASGISFGPSGWDVDCDRRPRKRWWCGVTSEGGQCFGHLRLRERGGGRFTAYGHKIGCLD